MYSEYRRLTRARRRRRSGVGTYLTTRSSLWLAKDHLLSVDLYAYSERYKRFYFRDIQGFTIRTTRRRALWNVVLSVLLALCLVELLVDSTGFGAWEIFMVMLAVLIAAPLLVNIIRGPTCEVLLRTAVQVEELPSLSRIRRAQKVLDRVRPLIVAAQGQLTPEDIAVKIRESNLSSGTSATEPVHAAGADGTGVAVKAIEKGRVATGPLNLSL